MQGSHDQAPRVRKAAPAASGALGVALALGVGAAQELNAPEWTWIAAASAAAACLIASVALFVRAWTLESAAAFLRNEMTTLLAATTEPSREAQLVEAFGAIQAELRRNRSDLNHHSKWGFSEPEFRFRVTEWHERRRFFGAQHEARPAWASVSDAYQRLERLNEWLTSEDRKRHRIPEDLTADHVSKAIGKADVALSRFLMRSAHPEYFPEG
jgi:hypothetical protein